MRKLLVEKTPMTSLNHKEELSMVKTLMTSLNHEKIINGKNSNDEFKS